MGFRFRKSINLGGGFRINLSKSGASYSWGHRGYRISKTVNGSTRTTVSVPGTGISYVHETKENAEHLEEANGSNLYDTQSISNNVASAMVSDGLEEMLSEARKILRLNSYVTIGLIISLILSFGFPILFIPTIVFVALKIFIKTKGVIYLNYSIDNNQQALFDEKIDPMIRIAECKKVWRVMQTSKVLDKRYSAGAINSVKRDVCKSSTIAPFPFKVNIKVVSFKTAAETLLFLPDKMLIIQGSKVGALNYSDITFQNRTTRFVEDGAVPSDANIIGQTWKYLNKSGSPDKRFKHNRQLPICLYGELSLSSELGLNTVIMYSNPGEVE